MMREQCVSSSPEGVKWSAVRLRDPLQNVEPGSFPSSVLGLRVLRHKRDGSVVCAN